MTESAQREGVRQRINEMIEFLNEQTGKVEKIDEQLVRRLIDIGSERV